MELQLFHVNHAPYGSIYTAYLMGLILKIGKESSLFARNANQLNLPSWMRMLQIKITKHPTHRINMINLNHHQKVIICGSIKMRICTLRAVLLFNPPRPRLVLVHQLQLYRMRNTNRRSYYRRPNLNPALDQYRSSNAWKQYSIYEPASLLM